MPETDTFSSWHGRVNVRVVALGAVTLLSLGMLWRMYTEQETVHRCTKMTAKEYSQMDRPIQVLVQNPCPKLNESVCVHKEVQSEVKSPKEKKSGKWDYNWDKRQWSDPSEAQGVGVRTLLLVRHGKYDMKTGLLDKQGESQANLTGLRLREMGMTFSRVVHSTMDRARQTALIISAHLPGVPVMADDMIKEGGPLPPDPTVTYWGLPDKDYHTDGPRLEAAFRKYFHRADKSQTEQSFELIVAHGNIIRYCVLRALQLDPSAWMRVFIAHASITLIHINPDGTLTMTRFGDNGHIPNNMVTY